MPARSKAQQRFFGAELSRKRSHKETETDMTTKEIKKFAGTKHKGLPAKVKGGKK